jgi:hypothetical protein
MTSRLRTGCLAGAFVALGLALPAAGLGAPPVIERIPVDETFEDELLSEECGVPVTTTVSGHIIVRTFSGDRTGPAEVRTINVAAIATAGDRTFRLRDVGADVTRIEPDGTMVLLISGQVPFDFAGVLKIDLETGEAILEPRDRSEQQLARACAVLTGG